jgi:putative ATPase
VWRRAARRWTCLASAADGDARRALTTLEIAAAPPRPRAGRSAPTTCAERSRAGTCVTTERAREHFNLISALHKSLRDSDPDASLYWFGRMVAAGEDRLYIARRLVRFASEDVGLADPSGAPARGVGVQCVPPTRHARGRLALAQVVVHLALAPKSNAIYTAYGAVMAEIEKSGSLPPPKVILNAPTRLMKDLGYGEGYAYAHDEPEAAKSQQHLPDELVGRTWLKLGKRQKH